MTAPELRTAAEQEGTPPRPAVSIRGAVKAFGDLRAVDGLDLDVRAGTCLGLLGPNGAGKSTTMKLLTAQVIADSGTIEVLGLPVPERSKQARAQMGVVPAVARPANLEDVFVLLTGERVE